MAAAATLVPLREYLSTAYHPDCDYVDGELEERNMGEQPHSSIQIYLGYLFRSHRDDWGVRALSEQRVQVSSKNYRIPDLCVLRRSDPRDLIVRIPPLLCIEILSSADTLTSLQRRVNDYLDMGVAHIWVLDPWNRLGYYATARGYLLPESGILRVEGTPIQVSLAEVFAELDEA